jgi:DNA-binding response OmpR family regulator
LRLHRGKREHAIHHGIWCLARDVFLVHSATLEKGKALPKILIIDDDPDAAEVAAHKLQAEPSWKVQFLKGPFIDLNQLEDGPVDIILLDVEMPALSGEEAIRFLQGTTRFKDSKILFHSSVDEEKLKMLAITKGASGYIHKSASAEDMIAKVKKALG